MGAAENRNKSQAMAADLLKRGYPHGRRASRPAPNSSGNTLTGGPGSSRYQRLVATQRSGRKGGKA